MKLAQKLNALLAKVNLVVIRRHTFVRILTELQALQNANSSTGLQPHIKLIEEQTDKTMRHLQNMRKELLRRQIASKWEVVDFMLRAMPNKNINRQCPLCNFEDKADAFTKIESQCLFGGGQLLRHQCPSCEVIFGSDKIFQLSNAELSQEYEWHYSVYDEGDSTEQELRAFHALQPSRDGAYLNYGSGAWSRSIQILRAEGWNVLAFEPHDSASTGADYVISNRSLLSTMKFDGVFSNNVLEHLPQPVSELLYMRSLLKAGGRMSHATPCFEYLYEYTRFHLFFYLGRSRALLANQANLSITEYISDGEFMCCVMELPK